ncbi:hypothetical protein cypCar_00046215, partial [Cyprinus carpio]
LSDGDRRVTRDASSFCHGLTFSGRPVERGEKVRLRVERSDGHWHGALRLGFANVSPEQTPLAPLAIPDLTDSPLYAAVVVPEHICRAGSEVHFWLKKNGSSKMKRWILTSRSCPARTHIKHTEKKETLERKKDVSMLGQRNLRNHHRENTDHEAPDCEECVVCYSDVANCRLSCGHKCVCTPCAMRVHMMFGTCPLCRQPLGSFHPYDH